MKVREIMTTDVVVARPGTTYKELVEQLVDSGVSGLPVVDDRGRLVGIVTEADLVSREAYTAPRHRALALVADLLSARQHHWVTKASGRTARDVMTENPTSCGPGDEVRVIARRMLSSGVKRLPVVENGRLVGIVSRQDVLRTFARPDDAIAADVERRLRTDPNRPADNHVDFSVVDGIVTLTGDVRFEVDKAIVVSLVRDVEGVIEVNAYLHHREAEPMSRAAPWG